MSNRQIQPVRPRDYQLARQVRPRSLWAQIGTVVLQPGYFFRTLAPASDSRQWVWVAILILGLVGFSAIRQEEILNAPASAPVTSPDFSSQPGDTAFPGASIGTKGDILGGSIPINPGGGGGTGTTPSDTTSPGDVSATLTTGLIAASYILLGWFVLALLLCEVPLLNGHRPDLGQNLQIAIWTTVPFGIMAGVQLVYFAAGGGVGQPGLSGLLAAWKPYDSLPDFTKNIALSLAIRLTIFWVWTLLLIYRGGRIALEGKRWAVMVVVIAWVIVLVVTPIVTGMVSAAPNTSSSDTNSTDTFPFNNLGLVDPSSQLPNDVPNSTLPPELQFLNGSSNPTPEATSESGNKGIFTPIVPPSTSPESGSVAPEITPASGS